MEPWWIRRGVVPANLKISGRWKKLLIRGPWSLKFSWKSQILLRDSVTLVEILAVVCASWRCSLWRFCCFFIAWRWWRGEIPIRFGIFCRHSFQTFPSGKKFGENFIKFQNYSSFGKSGTRRKKMTLHNSNHVCIHSPTMILVHVGTRPKYLENKTNVPVKRAWVETPGGWNQFSVSGSLFTPYQVFMSNFDYLYRTQRPRKPPETRFCGFKMR